MARSVILKVLFLSLAFALSHPFLTHAKIVDKVLAVVNSEVITQSEVDRLLYPIYQQYSNIYKNEEELYKRLDQSRLDILKQLVNDKLILSEARKLEIKVEEKEVDEEIAKIKKELAEDGMQLEDLLKEQKLSMNDLKNRYKEQLMIRKAVEQEVSSKVSLQPSEIGSYYHANIGDYTQPEQVAVNMILIKLENERNPIESRQLASDVLAMIKKGADFKETARIYSEGPQRESGGDLGYVERGQLLNEIDNVIFFLKTGDISDVIETPVGYYIFRVYDRIDEKVLPFEEVRMKVTENLFRKKAQGRFEQWLEKLRSNAYISIK